MPSPGPAQPGRDAKPRPWPQVGAAAETGALRWRKASQRKCKDGPTNGKRKPSPAAVAAKHKKGCGRDESQVGQEALSADPGRDSQHNRQKKRRFTVATRKKYQAQFPVDTMGGAGWMMARIPAAGAK